jgi:hypothetical protein
VSDYLVINAGRFERRAALSASAGVDDAGKLARTGANGKFDNSLINWDAPGAIGATTPAVGNFTAVAAGSPSALNALEVFKGNKSTETRIQLQIAGANSSFWNCQNTIVQFGSQANVPLAFLTNGSERARLSAGGRFLVASTTDDGTNALQVTGTVKFSGALQYTAPSWITLTLVNGFSNYGIGAYTNSTAAYRKHSGFVEIRGLIKRDSSGLSVAIANLPTGYRPSTRKMYIAPCSSSMGVVTTAEVDIDPTTGDLYLRRGDTTGYLSIEIVFGIDT